MCAGQNDTPTRHAQTFTALTPSAATRNICGAIELGHLGHLILNLLRLGHGTTPPEAAQAHHAQSKDLTNKQTQTKERKSPSK